MSNKKMPPGYIPLTVHKLGDAAFSSEPNGERGSNGSSSSSRRHGGERSHSGENRRRGGERRSGRRPGLSGRGKGVQNRGPRPSPDTEE